MVRVIQIAGLSGSGKTTFIRALIPLLARSGPVGTVKHAGHHAMKLPEGKDTTVMLGAGAAAVAGIDQEKTLITLKNTSLSDALDILSGRGTAYVIVEGYKSSPLPKIAIGDVEVEGCILRNPSPEEAIRSLDRFPSYYTLEELLRELEDECRKGGRPCSFASAAIPLSGRRGEKAPPALERSLSAIRKSTKDLPLICPARLVIHRGSLFGKSDEVLIAVAAGQAEEAAAALERIVSRCRELSRLEG
jgi:molybdopterin-guanine dinucleotide biosynthesis protein MobB